MNVLVYPAAIVNKHTQQILENLSFLFCMNYFVKIRHRAILPILRKNILGIYVYSYIK